MSQSPSRGFPILPAASADIAAAWNKMVHQMSVADSITRVESVGDNAPPGLAVDGAAYIVGQSPTGPWAGKPDNLAVSDGVSWAFYEPTQCPVVLNAATGRLWRYDQEASPPIWGLVPFPGQAIAVVFDNTVTGYSATDLQAAIDEADEENEE